MASKRHSRTDSAGHRRSSLRRTVILSIIGGLIIGALGVGGYFALNPPTPETAPRPRNLDLEIQPVTRGDLTEQLRIQGTLGYSEPRAMGSALTGTVTRLPGIGKTLKSGSELFWIDENPVFLIRGERPAWRDITKDITPGSDVLQLEKYLSHIGFFTDKPDDEFTAATTSAIKAWQKSLGQKATGTIEFGRVIFSPKDLRVQGHKITISEPASSEIITVTNTRKVVSTNLETTQKSLVNLDDKVTVVFPGGESATSTVTSIDAPREVAGEAGSSVKIAVTMTLDDPKAGENLEQVTVTVAFLRVLEKDVLQAPIVGLLAQPGGGFAVERVTASGTELVEVKLGAFASGQVTIVGGTLAEGDRIVVAK